MADFCVWGEVGGGGGEKWKHHSEYYFLSFFSNDFHNILETWEIINLPHELTVYNNEKPQMVTLLV